MLAANWGKVSKRWTLQRHSRQYGDSTEAQAQLSALRLARLEANFHQWRHAI